MAPPCTFSTLPREIKVHIFSYIPQKELRQSVAKTCREWENLAYDAELWKDFEFNKHDDEKEIVKILTCSQIAQRVTFSNTHFFVWSLSYPGCTFTSVRELNFQSCFFSLSDFNILLELLPNIQKLTFDSSTLCSKSSIRNNHEWNFLKEVYLKNMSATNTNNFIRLLSIIYNNLEVLVTRNCGSVSDSAFVTFVDQIKNSLSHLEVYFDDVTSVSYKALCQCDFLKELHIFNANTMTDQDLYALQKLQFLESLTIHKAKDLFSCQFPCLFAGVEFQRLNVLRLDECPNLDDSSFKVLINCCPELRKICLFKLERITSDITDALYDCEKLTELTLCCVPNLTDVTKIKLLLRFSSTTKDLFVVTRYVKMIEV